MHWNVGSTAVHPSAGFSEHCAFPSVEAKQWAFSGGHGIKYPEVALVHVCVESKNFNVKT